MGLEILWEWSMFALRWLHVVAAIAWIGSSFYFIALDLGLKKAKVAPAGVLGEEWQVHGGGFYHIQKYGVAPEHMPEDLTWFKWEAYTTWLSGFALLCVMYYAGAELYLIDPAVMPLSRGQAILISIVVLVAGWVVYDQLCKRLIAVGDTAVFIILFLYMALVGFALTHLYSGRGAFIHVGAMTATIMAANVAMVIIPNQRVVVADLIAGRKPDAIYGKIAKQRSLHNNYLTLPVIFFFLANHYPLATNTKYSWLIIAVVLIMGALIRHFFNTLHATGRYLMWVWVATAGLFIVIIGLSTYPAFRSLPEEAAAGVPFDPLDGSMKALVASDEFSQAQATIMARCSMCHAQKPLWEGMSHPPLGVVLESEYDIAREAPRIARQAVMSRAMPPGNVTRMTEAERAQIGRWLRGG